MSFKFADKTLSLVWKRPESSEFPRVWRTFKAKDIDSDAVVEYHVQDLSKSRFDDALDFMVSIFSKSEPLCEAYGMVGFNFKTHGSV